MVEQDSIGQDRIKQDTMGSDLWGRITVSYSKNIFTFFVQEGMDADQEDESISDESRRTMSSFSLCQKNNYIFGYYI